MHLPLFSKSEVIQLQMEGVGMGRGAHAGGGRAVAQRSMIAGMGAGRGGCKLGLRGRRQYVIRGSCTTWPNRPCRVSYEYIDCVTLSD